MRSTEFFITVLAWNIAWLALGTPPAMSPPATTAPATTAPAQTQPAREKLVIAGETFQLEVAADPAMRERGLMGRTEIAADGGMLFIYPRPQVMSFWMANCLIDIDVIFLDADGLVVATHKMKAEPPKTNDESQAAYEARMKRYSSRRAAQFAIELKAGSIERLVLKTGQRITLEIERLKKLAN